MTSTEAATGLDTLVASGDVSVSDERVVKVLVDGEPITFNVSSSRPDPRTFRPERLHIEWHNGLLYQCYVDGPRLTKDGSKYATGESVRLSFAFYGYGAQSTSASIADWTPQWVRDLVGRYAPIVTPPAVSS
jgi:hypothetical protein